MGGMRRVTATQHFLPNLLLLNGALLLHFTGGCWWCLLPWMFEDFSSELSVWLKEHGLLVNLTPGWEELRHQNVWCVAESWRPHYASNKLKASYYQT